nr:MAG: hypothetical protein DIU55_08290 [Bacillota bacterium]
MGMISEAALAHARARLSRMVGPVVLRVQSGSTEMRALAERLAEGELLTVEEWPGEGLTLRDGYGRDTGMVFRDLPVGQELDALVEAILAASRGGSVLSPLGRQQAAALPAGTRLQVLTTPA